MNARAFLESFSHLVGQTNRLSREQATLARHAREGGPYRDLWQAQADAQAPRLALSHTLAQRRHQEIEQAIRRLPDAACARALTLRFLRLLPYMDIADILHYSERHVYRLIEKGIRMLDGLRTPGGTDGGGEDGENEETEGTLGTFEKVPKPLKL